MGHARVGWAGASRDEAGPQGSGGAAQVACAEYVLRHLAAPLEQLLHEELGLTRGEDVVVVNAKARGAPPKTSFLPQGYSKDGGERQLCDTCGTTIFNRYWTCVHCGFEARPVGPRWELCGVRMWVRAVRR